MPEGTTIWQAAKDAGIEIPVLCHDERYDPVGVCRMCVVDVGGRVLAAACVRPCEDEMEVETATPEVERSRAMLTELLLADQPPTRGPEGDHDRPTTSSSRSAAGTASAQDGSRAPARPRRGDRPLQPGDRRRPRRLHPLRPLRPRLRRHPVQRRHRPHGQGLRHPHRLRPQRPDGRVSASPAASAWRRARPARSTTSRSRRPDPPARGARQVDIVCPYCGVGCALTYHVDDERNAISFAEGREQPGSQSRLCVKGRYGWDYAASTQRLTDAAHPPRASLPEGPALGRRPRRRAAAPQEARAASSTTTRSCRTSARRPGTRRSTSPPRA